MYLPIRQRETWVNLALSLCACISVMIACDLLVIKVSAQGRTLKNGGDNSERKNPGTCSSPETKI